MQNYIKILFLGDIVGRPGRRIVREFLERKENLKEVFFIIANVENASHGFGLTKKNHDELSEMGIDCFTSGNHIWDKRDVYEYIETSEKLIRPLNYSKKVKGVGYRIIEKNGIKIAVVNLLGQVFMNVVNSPWDAIKEHIEEIKKVTPIVIIDFHAEASAEKICFAKFCSELKVSAVLGTHTHVQTADEKIINNYTGYITDAGFCGASDGVIGMSYDISLAKLTTSLPERYDVAEGDECELNAVLLSINPESGECDNIERIIVKKVYNEV